MAWEKTWLFRMKDCFLVPWKLDGEVINLEDIPARAFDTTDEKDRVALLLEQYNERRYDLLLRKMLRSGSSRESGRRGTRCVLMYGCLWRGPSLSGLRRGLNCCRFRGRCFPSERRGGKIQSICR